MKIVNFGSCNIDYVYKLHHIVHVGETEHSEGRDVFPGGKGLNQSIAIAKAGATVYHAGLVGADGGLLLDTMQECGVDTSFVKKVDAPSGHAIIQVSSKGENSIFIHSGANGMITKEYVDEVLSHFEAGDLLVLQNEINNTPYIVQKAYERGMHTLINPSPIDENIEKIDFSQISYAVLNEIEGEFLTGHREPAKIISTLRARHPLLKIVLTLGDKGCMYHDGERLYYHSAYEVTAVDTTAAGDTFLGYFVAGLAIKEEPEETLQRASIAAALAVSVKGAAPSIPYVHEVQGAYGTMEPKDTGFSSVKDNFTRLIDNYLEINLRSATLSGLAEELGYSPVYTGQLFKKAKNMSFGKYVQAMRCSVAADLLRNTNLSVSQIINQIGYSNETFFRDKFKELYGVAPLTYRKTLQNQGGKKK